MENEEKYRRNDDERRQSEDSPRRDGEGRRFGSREADGQDGGYRPRVNRNSDGERRPFRPRYNNDGDQQERRPSFRPRYNEDGDQQERRPNFRPRYNDGDDQQERRPSFRPRYNNDDQQQERRPSFRPRYNDGGEQQERRPFRPRYNDEDGGERRPSFRPRNNGGDYGNRQQGGRSNGGRFDNRQQGNGRRPQRGRQEGGNKQWERKPWHQKAENVKGPRYKVDYSLFDREEDDELSGQNPQMQGMPEQLRLNRFIAMSGVCSRREADDLIKAGRITVNGDVVTEMGVIVSPEDKVTFDGKELKAEKKVYVLLNKPKDCVTTTDDPEERRTVMDLVEDAATERIFPVGRLDRNTTGVLLLTNDGDMAEKLMHPRYEVRKIYHVFLDKNVSQEDLEMMLRGIELEDGPVAVDEVSYVDNRDKSQVGVVLHSGRNRIVRRIFEHFGYNVERLDRVYYGGLTKKNVPRGHWRYLTDEEVNRLKAGFVR